jgi:hypothetical protein
MEGNVAGYGAWGSVCGVYVEYEDEYGVLYVEYRMWSVCGVYVEYVEYEWMSGVPYVQYESEYGVLYVQYVYE